MAWSIDTTLKGTIQGVFGPNLVSFHSVVQVKKIFKDFQCFNESEVKATILDVGHSLDNILEEGHPRSITPKFDSVWPCRGSKREKLMKVNGWRTPSELKNMYVVWLAVKQLICTSQNAYQWFMNNSWLQGFRCQLTHRWWEESNSTTINQGFTSRWWIYLECNGLSLIMW